MSYKVVNRTNQRKTIADCSSFVCHPFELANFENITRKLVGLDVGTVPIRRNLTGNASLLGFF